MLSKILFVDETYWVLSPKLSIGSRMLTMNKRAGKARGTPEPSDVLCWDGHPPYISRAVDEADTRPLRVICYMNPLCLTYMYKGGADLLSLWDLRKSSDRIAGKASIVFAVGEGSQPRKPEGRVVGCFCPPCAFVCCADPWSTSEISTVDRTVSNCAAKYLIF